MTCPPPAGPSITEYALAAAAVISSIASAVAIFVQATSARRQIKATIISASRQRWIDGFREDIAEVIALIDGFERHMGSFMADRTEEGLKMQQARFDYEQRAQLILNRIRLRLNETEQDSIDVVGFLQASISKMRLDSRVREHIITTSQRIIKTEWGRVRSLQ